MNKLGFIIGGAVTVIGVATTAYFAKKLYEQKKETITTEKGVDANGEPIIETRVITPVDRIKEAAMKKAVRIMGWVVVHEQQVQAVGTVISVVAACFSLVNEVKKYSMGKSLLKRLGALENGLQRLENSTCGHVNNLGKYVNEMWDAIDNNMRMIYEAVNVTPAPATV